MMVQLAILCNQLPAIKIDNTLQELTDIKYRVSDFNALRHSLPDRNSAFSESAICHIFDFGQ